jgi:phosphohistidine phosphatase
MILYVIRHAAAEPAGPAGDFDRPLTALGRMQAREVGRALQARGSAIAAILSSPAERAWQTAELILAELTPAPSPVRADPLYQGIGAVELLELLRPWEGKGDLVVVSHMPGIEHLTRAFLEGPAELRFTPGSAYGLEFPGPLDLERARVAWRITP